MGELIVISDERKTKMFLTYKAAFAKRTKLTTEEVEYMAECKVMLTAYYQEKLQSLKLPLITTRAITSKITFLTMYNISKGHISKACRAAGISRSTFYLWNTDDPTFSAIVDEVVSYSLDDVENALHSTAIGGNFGAQRYLLENKRPDQWRSKVYRDDSVTFAAGSLESKSTEEIDRLYEEAMARKAAIEEAQKK